MNNDNLQLLNHELLFDRTGKVLNITNQTYNKVSRSIALDLA